MSTKSANINKFISSLGKDVSRPARFEVEIPIPLKLIRYHKMMDRLTLRCESGEFPSVHLNTVERKIYGTTEKMPYLRMYSEITFNFIMSGDMSEKAFFDAWIETIIPRSSQNMLFKDEYASTITVKQFGVDGKVTYKNDLTKAFPVSIGSLSLDWSNETSYHRLPVTFSFFEVEPSGFDETVEEVIDSAVASGVNFLTDILSGSSDDWKMTNIASKMK